jgi:hypothetical protein
MKSHRIIVEGRNLEEEVGKRDTEKKTFVNGCTRCGQKIEEITFDGKRFPLDKPKSY